MAEATARRRPFLPNLSWLALERLARLVTGFLVNIAMVRYLGPEHFGLLSYAQGLVALSIPLVAFGLDNLLIRELTRGQHPAGALLGTVFTLKLVGAALAFLLLVLALASRRFTEVEALASILIFSPFFQTAYVIDIYFQSRVESRFVVMARLAQLSLGSLARLCLILSGSELVGFAWLLLAETAFLALALVVVFRRRGLASAWRFDPALARLLTRESLPMLGMLLCATAQGQLDQVLLGHWTGAANLGQYVVGLRMVEMFAFIPEILGSTFAPLVAAGGRRGTRALLVRLAQIYRLAAVAAVAASLAIAALGGPLLIFLYGEAFQPAAALLPGLAFYVWAQFLRPVRTLYLINAGLTGYGMAVAAGGALISLTFNIFLIPSHAAWGAITASVTASAFVLFGADTIFRQGHPNLAALLRGLSGCHRLGTLWRPLMGRAPM